MNKLLLKLNYCSEHDLVFYLFFRYACMLSEISPYIIIIIGGRIQWYLQYVGVI